MNEQIEYLFDQALEEFKAENKYTTIVVPDPLQRDFIEKFAKLIVQECMEVSLGCSHRDDDMGAIIARQIKQHFGV
jgi:hypothetical protein